MIMGSGNSFFSILAVAPSVFFVSVSGVAKGYLNGVSDLKPIAVSQLIEAVSKVIFGLSFALFAKTRGFDLSIIAAFSVFGITLGSLFSFVYLLVASKSKKRGDIKGQTSIKIPKSILKKLARIAIPIALGSSLLSLSSVVDVGIIIRALNTSGATEVDAVSLYGNYSTLALPMLNLVTALLAPICVAYLPKLASLHLSSDVEQFNKTLEKTVLIISIVASPIACA